VGDRRYNHPLRCLYLPPISKETVQQGTTPPFLDITDKGDRCFEMRSGTDQPASTVCPFVDTTTIFENKQ